MSRRKAFKDKVIGKERLFVEQRRSGVLAWLDRK